MCPRQPCRLSIRGRRRSRAPFFFIGLLRCFYSTTLLERRRRGLFLNFCIYVIVIARQRRTRPPARQPLLFCRGANKKKRETEQTAHRRPAPRRGGSDDRTYQTDGEKGHIEWPRSASSPDDILYYIVDAYLDDRSLGACLLAWRRFHVLDAARLCQRKYRLATPLALCAAGDMDGFDYVSRRPDIFGRASSTAEHVCAAQTGGHARMTVRLMRDMGLVERLAVRQWSFLALAAALRGPDDRDLVWLCHRDNRPQGPWDDAALVCACARATGSGHSRDAVLAALEAIEALAGLPTTVSRDIWCRLSCVEETHPPSLSPADVDTLASALYTHMRGSPYCEKHVSDLIRRGHLRLLLDLMGDDTIARLLKSSGFRCSTPVSKDDDVDSALWLYDRVAVHGVFHGRLEGLMRLALAVARSNRADLFDGVDSRAAALYDQFPELEPTLKWTDVCVEASVAGHTAATEWALAHHATGWNSHRLAGAPAFLDAFRHCRRCDDAVLAVQCNGCMGVACTVRSPLAIHRDRRDLFALLLDRRPRPGIPQKEVNARVDVMVDITVQDALSRGDLGVLRRVHAVEPQLVEAAVERMRVPVDAP
ncbi:hypothetical protein [Pandoravirus japonicus]|uniref:Uncharacterized protein n=1 Tax=Pandoravirus japonicus TaxID=2823154 RepID=A0A811BNR6_9VIRU|nr:hypothetical protein [Pandoravirus japonicus]